jgi:endonuclease YncB( thermonuclease family)
LKIRTYLFSAALFLLATAADAESFLRVIDGDTIDLDHVRYRLHGIDAPEAGQNCKTPDGGEWACGQAALHKIEGLVLGKKVTCEPKGNDLYGRVIAICSADGVVINEAMISSGMAWAFRKYSEDYVTLEDEAHAKRVGIWQAPTETAWVYRTHKWDTETVASPQANCPIKGNINRKHEKIYHAPWSKDYGKTRIDTSKGERWFCTEAEAVAAGWRPPAFGR